MQGRRPSQTVKKMPLSQRRLFLLAVMMLAVVMDFAAPNWAVAQQPKPQAPQQAAVPDVVLPSAETTLILIRATLLTLNDALRTGNYTVLRDVASPSFREANTAGRLYEIFLDLNAKHIDLSSVAILAPQVPQAPSIDQNRRLHIAGYFPGSPIQLNFDLIFEAVNNQWRLFGLSVNPAISASANFNAAPASPPANPAPANTPPPAQKGKPGK